MERVQRLFAVALIALMATVAPTLFAYAQGMGDSPGAAGSASESSASESDALTRGGDASATRGADMGTTGSGAAMSSPDMQDQSMQRGMTDSSMMQQGAVDSSMQRGSAAAGADSALRNEFRSSYQSGYTEGFTDGFSKSDQAHGTMGAQRGAMRDGMTGHPPISSSQHGWIKGYQDGFKDGFKAGL